MPGPGTSAPKETINPGAPQLSLPVQMPGGGSMMPGQDQRFGGMTPGQALGGEMTMPEFRIEPGVGDQARNNFFQQMLSNNPGMSGSDIQNQWQQLDQNQQLKYFQLPPPAQQGGYYGSSNPFSQDVVWNQGPNPYAAGPVAPTPMFGMTPNSTPTTLGQTFSQGWNGTGIG